MCIRDRPSGLQRGRRSGTARQLRPRLTGRVRAQRLSLEAQRAFTHVPERDRERARVLVVAWLTPGVAAMTIDRFVLVRRGHESSVGLLAHELVHVQQWRESGPTRFLARYLCEYFANRWQGMSHWAAYAAISAEVEARARSGH